MKTGSSHETRESPHLSLILEKFSRRLVLRSVSQIIILYSALRTLSINDSLHLIKFRKNNLILNLMSQIISARKIPSS